MACSAAVHTAGCPEVALGSLRTVLVTVAADFSSVVAAAAVLACYDVIGWIADHTWTDDCCLRLKSTFVWNSPLPESMSGV